MQALLPLILQLIAGGAGGNIIGQIAKNYSLGTTGNSAVGAIGGAVGSWIISHFVGAGAQDPMAIAALIQSVLGGGVSGAVVTLVVGVIKNLLGSK